MPYVPLDPRVGQGFYDKSRIGEGEANGKIIRVTPWEQEVVVQFSDGCITSYDYYELENCWTEKFGGIWRL